MKRGDRRGLDGFDGRFQDLAVLADRAAYRILGSAADAEEIAQEALARAYARWRVVSGHPEAWVVRVATNLALGRLRQERRRARFVRRPSGDADEAAATRLDLVELLKALPKRQLDTVALRFVADLSEQDTADALGVSVGTVKRHSHRALASLRRSIGETGAGEPIPPGRL